MLKTPKRPILGRFFTTLTLLTTLAGGTNQRFLNPYLEKQLQDNQPEVNLQPTRKETRRNHQQSDINKKRLTNFISELRSKRAPSQAPEGDSPFPFDPDRGYLNIFGDDGGNSMWYWHFRARKNPTTAPLIIWLDGGPGAASSAAVFMSNGPYTFNNFNPQNPRVYFKNTTWAQVANMVYPDYPLGVGFSTVTSEHVALGKEQVMNQILIFFKNFLKKYPEYKKRPLYIAGASYAGHWVPYAATALKYSGNPDINVQGFYITDGMMNATTMLNSYPEFAIKSYKYTRFTQQDAEAFTNLKDLCIHSFFSRLNKLYTVNYIFLCLGPYFTGLVETIKSRNPKFNPYYMPGGPSSFNLPFVQFLNIPSIQNFLGVRKHQFQFENNTFGSSFLLRDFYVDTRPMIARLLDDGIKGAIVVGELDFITDYDQSEQVVADMKWKHQSAYNSAKRTPCKVGLCKVFANLREYRVAGSGHGTSAWQPEKGLEIITEILSWEPSLV